MHPCDSSIDLFGVSYVSKNDTLKYLDDFDQFEPKDVVDGLFFLSNILKWWFIINHFVYVKVHFVVGISKEEQPYYLKGLDVEQILFEKLLFDLCTKWSTSLTSFVCLVSLDEAWQYEIVNDRYWIPELLLIPSQLLYILNLNFVMPILNLSCSLTVVCENWCDVFGKELIWDHDHSSSQCFEKDNKEYSSREVPTQSSAVWVEGVSECQIQV